MINSRPICFVIHGLSIGGAEKFSVNLVNELSARSYNLSLVSLSSNNPLGVELTSQIDMTIFPRKRKLDFCVLYSLRNLINKENPSKIFCINFFTFFYVKLCLIFKSKKPEIIISYHTTIPGSNKEYYLTKFYLSILGKRDSIVAVSHNQAKYIIDLYKINKIKVRVIQNCVNLSHWHLPSETFNRELFRRKYNINASDKLIILTAGFRPEKNHKGAVEALKILSEKYNPNVKLLLVGDGPLFEEVKNYANDLCLSEKVIFVGLQANVRPFYWISDLFTLTSTSVETFSIAALEAMSCGLPCVLTNIGGASEMIIEGVNGFLMELDANNIAFKWNMALNRNFNANKIHDFSKANFSQDRMIKSYIKLLT